jgi:RHS repeat-associated protein
VSGGTVLAYKYDADGNRTSLVAGTTTTYSIAAASNRLIASKGAGTRTLSYDLAGNTTLDDRAVTMLGYTYDASGRLVTAKTGAFTTSYTNDGLGERVSRSGYGAAAFTGGKQAFVYDMAGHLVGEYDGTGRAIEETVWLGNLPIAVLVPGKTPYYIAPDQLGAPHQIASATRATVWHWDHDPFGNGAPAGSLAYNPRFPGQYFDSETGLHYNGFRDYDPSTGRYIQSDPIGLNGGVNTYFYANVDPLRTIDPDGMDAWTNFESQFIGLANLTTGVVDASTFELTVFLHKGLGKNDFVDPCSFYYRFGHGLGVAVGYGKLAKAYWDLRFLPMLWLVKIKENGQAYGLIPGSWGRATVSSWVQDAISGGKDLRKEGIERPIEEFIKGEECTCEAR